MYQGLDRSPAFRFGAYCFGARAVVMLLVTLSTIWVAELIAVVQSWTQALPTGCTVSAAVLTALPAMSVACWARSPTAVKRSPNTPMFPADSFAMVLSVYVLKKVGKKLVFTERHSWNAKPDYSLM
jgi:hypothetical protein